MLTLRARDVPLAVLSPELKHFEWTYTALYLAFKYTIAITDALTFRYHRTPGSLSQTRQHILTEPEMWWRVIRLFQGSKYERLARVRLGRALHDVATVHYEDGKLTDALNAHLAGLTCPAGWRRYGLSARLALELVRSATSLPRVPLSTKRSEPNPELSAPPRLRHGIARPVS
jgi:hypothetical protein